ncbi:SDR family oxidoreductase [Mangrovimicrobium sediminis]|uniref:SDR family oxidoreductase n=1 Tax=Mangrovimicrobium sediminis TaxID=2562682 RepID=A0A4Z0LVE5_9GAMM|nr:SDR family NAD(P)-dependent oxidoreductase [Haliea sp. SAOS-164]TGD71373.1 SDR family oxidoreductase [Haliea sp. SAOS-164]
MIGEDPLDLDGQVAFVTGAGQGAGRGIAHALARHNAGGVAVNDFVAERAEIVAAEIRELGVPAVGVQADVGDHASVAAAMKTAAEALGPATLLVNNAGNAGPRADMGFSPPFWEADPGEWDKFMRTNLYGVMNCCHLALPAMVEAGRGRVVTIVSDSGRVGEARLSAYSAAKAGAAALMRSLAKETGRYGITCNAVSLSTLEPPMSPEELEGLYANERVKAQLSRYTLRRFGKPDDVAGMVLFLCSDAAAWITGQTYPVNGGYSFSQ